MIGYLEGTVLHRLDDAVLLHTSGGVGYHVFVPLPLLAAGLAMGEPAQLHITTIVRETEISLYGFEQVHAKRLFEMLLKASGVGPKLALSFLSSFGPQELVEAISRRDLALLATIPGVGRKTADRLCVELGDRMGSVVLPADPASSGRKGPGDLISALTNLGFPEKDVVPVVRQMAEQGGAFSDQLKQALALLGRR